MLRNLSIIIIVTTGLCLAGCNGDQPTGIQGAPDISKPEVPQAEAVDPSTTEGLRVPNLPPPGDFVAKIDNRWMPLEPGTVFRYAGETEDGLETNVVEVTHDTKTILGIRTTVVHDQVFTDGELTEDTFDWYAQDEDDNVWYFGEDSKQIDHGQIVGTEGSWEAGVDDARPGIVMLGEPREDKKYRQEYAPDVAEDMAKVIELGETVRVPFGRYRHCLETEEWTPLEPGVREYKFYAAGIGLVLESLRPNGRGDRIELIAVEH